jgi:hypothetical protein
LEETKRNIKKMQKVTVGHFVVRKLEKSAYFTHPDFSAPKLDKKKSVQIMGVNMVSKVTL